MADPNAMLNDIRTLSGTVANGIPRVAWSMPGPNTFSYAECTANCSSATPTFSSAVVYGPPARTVEAGTMTASATAGVIAAVISSRGITITLADGGTTPGTAYDLYYGACTAGCLTPSNWSWVAVAFSVNNQIPQIATSATITGIAYGDGSDTQYAECPGNCTNANSWNDGEADPAPVDARPGLALNPPSRGIVGTNGDYFLCTSASCTGGNGWSSPGTGGSYDDGAFLYYQPNGLPRVFGHNNSNLRTSRCSGLPCTSSADWTGSQIATGAYTSFDQIDVAFDAQQRAWLAYRTAGTNINSVREEVDGGWTTSPLPACGTQFVGAMPVAQIAADGGMSVFYQATPFGEIRYYIVP